MPMGQSSEMVTVYCFGTGWPSASCFAVAVMPGCRKTNSLASSTESPLIVTSKVVPTCPPIGIVVSRRGAGRQTDGAAMGIAVLASTHAANNKATRRCSDAAFLVSDMGMHPRCSARLAVAGIKSVMIKQSVALVVEQKLFGIHQRP